MVGKIKKTHCPKGHPYNEENTAISGGVRVCKICRKEANDRMVKKRSEKRAKIKGD